VSRIDPKTIRFCIPTLIIASPAMSRRIGKLLQSPSLAPEKLDELQRKNNILSAFVHRKFDKAADALSDASLDDVEEAVRHATASVKVAAGQATDRVKQEL
jgi:protein disulfide-isomerase A6